MMGYRGRFRKMPTRPVKKGKIITYGRRRSGGLNKMSCQVIFFGYSAKCERPDIRHCSKDGESWHSQRWAHLAKVSAPSQRSNGPCMYVFTPWGAASSIDGRMQMRYDGFCNIILYIFGKNTPILKAATTNDSESMCRIEIFSSFFFKKINFL